MAVAAGISAQVKAGIRDYFRRIGSRGGKAGSPEAKREAGRIGALARWAAAGKPGGAPSPNPKTTCRKCRR